jgi:hypothetical protein
VGLVRRTLIALGLAAAALSLFLATSGGFVLVTPIGRLFLRSPVRSAAVAALALAAAAYLARRAFRRDTALVLAGMRQAGGWLAILVAGVTLTAGIAFSSRVAAGSDSYGYVSQALLWRSGSLVQEEPLARDVPWPHATFTLTPLGYRPAEMPPRILPTYPPGLPLLMAVADALGGFDAMFIVVPLMGGLAVLLTYALGRHLAGVGTGLAASLLLATHPSFTFQLLQPMSDVPATALWVAVALLAIGGHARRALLAGLVASGAILVRPNLAPLAIIVCAWLVGPRLIARAARSTARRGMAGGRHTGAPPRADLSLASEPPPSSRLPTRDAGPASSRARLEAMPIATPALWFGLGLLPGILALLAVNWHVSGHPLVTGYGNAADFYSPRHILPNLSRYPGWLAATHSWVVLGAAAAAPWFVVSPWRRLDRLATSGSTLMWLAVVGSYLPFLVFGDWTFLRMLLPGFPFALVLGCAALLRLASAVPRPWGVLGAGALVVALCGSQFAAAVTLGVFDVRAGQARYVAVADHLASTTAPDAIVLAFHHSGSIRLYAGRTTVRWDILEPRWLDPLIAWCRQEGREVLLALDAEEEDTFRQRFAGVSTFAALDWPARAETLPRGWARVFAPADRALYLAGTTVPLHRLDLTDRRGIRLMP